MTKKYQTGQTEEILSAAEPVCVYNEQDGSQTSARKESSREQVLTSTVSVDEYFDELIAQVHKDYANL